MKALFPDEAKYGQLMASKTIELRRQRGFEMMEQGCVLDPCDVDALDDYIDIFQNGISSSTLYVFFTIVTDDTDQERLDFIRTFVNKMLETGFESFLKDFLRSVIHQVETSPSTEDILVLKNLHRTGYKPTADAVKNIDPSVMIDMAQESLIYDDSCSGDGSKNIYDSLRILAEFKNQKVMDELGGKLKEFMKAFVD